MQARGQRSQRKRGSRGSALVSGVTLAGVLLAGSTVGTAYAVQPEPDHPAIGNGTGGGWEPGQELRQSPRLRQRIAAKLAAPVPVAGYPRRKVLDIRHIGQVRSYYCGPAAALMLLRTLREGGSAYSGARAIQENLADAHHLQTDANGATTWASDRMRIGLNRWRGDNFYVALPSPTNKQLRKALGSNLSRGIPFVADTVEFAGGYHYNNHPSNQTLGHWLTVQGYKRHRDVINLEDPAAFSPALSSSWAGLKANFDGRTNRFNQRYLQSNGIVW